MASTGYPNAAEIADAAEIGATEEAASTSPSSGSNGQSPNMTPEDALLAITEAATGMDRGKETINRLQAERRQVAQQKRQLTALLRNESRKRARLLAKSSKLSIPDLVTALHIRQAKAKAKSQES